MGEMGGLRYGRDGRVEVWERWEGDTSAVGLHTHITYIHSDTTANLCEFLGLQSHQFLFRHRDIEQLS